VAFAGRAGVSGDWTVVNVPSAQAMVTASKGIKAATATVGRISAAASAWVSPDEVVESAKAIHAREPT